DEGRKAGGLEAVGETRVRKTADCKRVVAQAVTVLQQQQVLAPQTLGFNAGLLGKLVLARQSHYEGILKQNDGLHRATIIGEREQHHVELPPMQRIDEALGQIFYEVEPEAAIGLAQAWQHLGQ